MKNEDLAQALLKKILLNIRRNFDSIAASPFSYPETNLRMVRDGIKAHTKLANRQFRLVEQVMNEILEVDYETP